jgi:NitT/TauT family transport system permease protein
MRLRAMQFVVFAALILLWHVFTTPGIIPPFYFEQDNRAAFFFGEPQKVFWVIVDWFWTGEIFIHLAVTLIETALGFAIGSAFGLGIGLWLALSPTASAVMDPYIKGFNSMPRVVLAPIFAVWFGLGIWSKVALGVTLVFFVVFFNVYQGVREVSPTLLANARMLGASKRQLLRSIYLPSAMSWVFASLHNAVGLAFVGAVVGEYLGSTFDINTVFAGIVVLTAFALVLDAAVGAVEGRLMTWQPRASETEKV